MRKLDEINHWLISEGRELGDGVAIVEEYAAFLVRAGVPLSRANIAQRFANPLLVAWGVVWTPDNTTQYDVTHAALDTASYMGGPFEYVLTNRTTLHKSLVGLDPETDHAAYLERADAGGTDLFATFLEYGDGSKHGCTFVTDDPRGFTQEHTELIQKTRHGLASAMEPVTMRKSTESLLQTYLGDGPARAVCEGTIQRGEHTALEAVVMFTDLREFTQKSKTWNEAALLAALNGYFDVVVQAVEANGGDVLKFIGDGILSIFPIGGQSSPKDQCRSAVDAARAALAGLDELNKEREKVGEKLLAMGIGINRGPVTYGNIGSPGRLDFTVIGTAVNVASRVQGLCKTIGEPVLATQQVAINCENAFADMGSHSVRGVDDPLEIFALKR